MRTLTLTLTLRLTQVACHSAASQKGHKLFHCTMDLFWHSTCSFDHARTWVKFSTFCWMLHNKSHFITVFAVWKLYTTHYIQFSFPKAWQHDFYSQSKMWHSWTVLCQNTRILMVSGPVVRSWFKISHKICICFICYLYQSQLCKYGGISGTPLWFWFHPICWQSSSWPSSLCPCYGHIHLRSGLLSCCQAGGSQRGQKTKTKGYVHV